MDISRIFNSESESVLSVLQELNVGYYIPLYQRKYSWDLENVDQLMEDIASGVKAFLESEDSIHFMGTLILVEERKRKENIRPQEPNALPSRIDNVIDGQQRLSTIAMLTCLLYRRVAILEEKIGSSSLYVPIKDAIELYRKNLISTFSVDIGIGIPNIKPIIIRGSDDGWTKEGKDEENYRSEVSCFLASFIRSIHENKVTDFKVESKSSLVQGNLKLIEKKLFSVEKAFKETKYFPAAWDLLKDLPEDTFRYMDVGKIKEIVSNRSNPPKRYEAYLCSLIQLLTFGYYLMHRCCFTVIRPESDIRAFDMFQSLNATGTPLTALETFKPLVFNFTESEGEFKESKIGKYFKTVDDLSVNINNAVKKNKLTDEFLTTFALTRDGSELYKRFSQQRSWLNERYTQCESDEEREEFVRQMSELAKYWTNAINFDPVKQSSLPGTESINFSDKALAPFCILYLQDAKHTIANAVLSRFYSQVIREVNNSAQEFVDACKCIAAFFTLWRSSLPNTGLDKIYRKILQDEFSYKKGNENLTAERLKFHFKKSLEKNGILAKEEWKNKAIDYLRYDNARIVCRFALFMTAEDTGVDESRPGLMSIERTGTTQSYLEPFKWKSKLQIEHVAPRSNEERSGWDPDLYKSSDFQRIGNLTLLPAVVNSSASNKPWLEKWIYYAHLSEKKPLNRAELQNLADINGISLNATTIDILLNTPYKSHIAPLVAVGQEGKWDKNLVALRTERICEILWERIFPWLS
jgi:hypothetical protein